MRPMLLVVPDVITKDCFEMGTAENERPVETLLTYGPYCEWGLLNNGAKMARKTAINAC